MAAFNNLVTLCRQSASKRVAGTDLVLRVSVNSLVIGLVETVEAGSWRTTIKRNGREVADGVRAFAEGEVAEIVVHGMARPSHVIVNSVGDLLSYNLGTFLGAAPDNFYVLQENYASGESGVPEMVGRYFRCLKMVRLLQRVADDNRPEAGTAGRAMILTSRKLDIPIQYRQWVLDSVPTDEAINESTGQIFDDHLSKGRLEAFRRVLVRYLFDVSESERFEVMIKIWSTIYQAFLADFDIYASGFNFDKAREEFERKKLDFVVKMNAASSDAMSKLIAIPVGQGLLASQMKSDAAYVIVNVSLLVASSVFFIVALMLISAHVLTIRQVGLELDAEAEVLKVRARPTYEQLRPMIEQLRQRIMFHKWLVPAVMLTLLVATTAMTCVAYLQLTK